MNDLCQVLMKRLTWIRHLSECHDLIQQNPKRPNVRFNRELVLMDGLWSSPFHREFSSFFGLIYILIFFLQTKQETQCISVSFRVKKCTKSPLFFFLMWQVKNVLCSQCLPFFFTRRKSIFSSLCNVTLKAMAQMKTLALQRLDKTMYMWSICGCHISNKRN